jgi:tetratricopeptide (TPR) repeat protein/SAM-dependent methyltransferase
LSAPDESKLKASPANGHSPAAPGAPPLGSAHAGESSDAEPRSFAIRLVEEASALSKQGRTAEAMARCEAAVQADPYCAPAHLTRGNLLLARGMLDEARRAYQLATACNPQYAEAHFNLGNLNYRAGQFAQALRDYRAAIDVRPQFADAFVGLANALVGLGRTVEAEESYQRALSINPAHAEAHFNLGALAVTQQRPQEGVLSLRKAIELRPGSAAAHHLLGAALSSLGDLEGAEQSLRRAWSIDPHSAALHYDLAMLLQYRGEYVEAAQLLARALERAPSWTIKVAFAACAARARFTANDASVRAALTAAIAEGWGMPHDLCRPALALVMIDERIGSCVRLADESWPARVPQARLLGPDTLAALAADPLLHALLDAVPVNSILFERFLTSARAALLEVGSSEQALAPPDAAALNFFAALARQCFINEYIFDCPEKELLVADSCRRKLLALLDAGTAIPPLLLLVVAAYFPLHSLRQPERLLAEHDSRPLDEVLRQQIREPLEERVLRQGVVRLTAISGGISAAVREQYEQHPYPRWVKMQLFEQPMSFNAELQRALPYARFLPLADDSSPEVLIAGCGTGSDAIFVASRFRGARVLAVDLSAGSLAYAQRKTHELGLTNLEYAQADILKLADIARTFDIIGAVGVLHHLQDPFEGWRILLSRLRPGGFMCLGLYSKIARRLVVKARELIAARGYSGTPDDIRRFRQDILAEDASVELRSLRHSHAFYSMSDCRDLAFHVQEKQLTLAQIESFLSEFGLRFVGFELEQRMVDQYRARFPDDPSCINLRNWSHFESDNPDTFTAMYRFWIQR